MQHQIFSLQQKLREQQSARGEGGVVAAGSAQHTNALAAAATAAASRAAADHAIASAGSTTAEAVRSAQRRRSSSGGASVDGSEPDGAGPEMRTALRRIAVAQDQYIDDLEVRQQPTIKPRAGWRMDVTGVGGQWQLGGYVVRF